MKKIICFLLLFPALVPVHAEPGVFQAKSAPHEVLTNRQSQILVTAEIGSSDSILDKVEVLLTTAGGAVIRKLGPMYDDGTHGDILESDTIFSSAVTLNPRRDTTIYLRVRATYGDGSTYLGSIIEVRSLKQISASAINKTRASMAKINETYTANLATTDLGSARQKALMTAKKDKDVAQAQLSGENLCLVYQNGVRGLVTLADPNRPNLDGTTATGGLGSLPANAKFLGNNKLLIFAPGYGDASPQRGIADHASSRFASVPEEHVEFDPNPPTITKDSSASLDSVATWGSYGTIIIHTHGGYWSSGNNHEVILLTGTPVNDETRKKWESDLSAGRVAVSESGKFAFFPSFITEHCGAMQDTFFYLGACESLRDDSLWNALKGKGAKVAFGWSETVDRGFNTATFKSLINPMLPTSTSETPATAKQAFDGIANKTDNTANNHGATLGMRVASSDWENFVFVEGGLVNGDFERGDWTGWTKGGDYEYGFVGGAKKYAGSYAGNLGRWDSAFHGQDNTAEPAGYEWFYQDFKVPNNMSKLSFWWWMETYDTANWDWFSAYILDTSGSTLATIVYKGGKPGYDYGPYWTSGAWKRESVDISAYRGQRIIIYFEQRLDGFGDQQRTYIDNVALEP